MVKFEYVVFEICKLHADCNIDINISHPSESSHNANNVPMMMQSDHLLAHIGIQPRLPVLSIRQKADETFPYLTLASIFPHTVQH